METMKSIWSALSGSKTYLCVAALMLLTFFAGGSAEGLDLARLVNDPELLRQEIVLALVAAFRSAIAKIGS